MSEKYLLPIVECRESELDYAQVVNAMMYAMESSDWWKRTLKEWSQASWKARENDVRAIVKMAWLHGKAETANIRAYTKGKMVILKVYRKCRVHRMYKKHSE